MIENRGSEFFKSAHKAKIVKFDIFVALIFCMCALTDARASIYDINISARLFDTLHDILRCLGLVQSLLKGQNAPIWHSVNRGVNAFQ